MGTDGAGTTGASSTLNNAIIAIPVANGLHDLKLEYLKDTDGKTQHKLLWQSASTPSAVVPSDRLYQSYGLSWKVGVGGGLAATYYDSDTLGDTPLKSTIDETVDWSSIAASDRPYAGSIGESPYSARWMGFIRPSRSDQYTFCLEMDSSEDAQLEIDNMKLDGWSSWSTSAEMCGTLGFPAANDYYEIKIRYRSTAVGVSKFRLTWENLGGGRWAYNSSGPNTGGITSYGSGVADPDKVFKGIIRSDRLFQRRSTFSRDSSDRGADGMSDLLSDRSGTDWSFREFGGCVDNADDECAGEGERQTDALHVDVKPASVCSSKSNVWGVALTISTAGVPRTFTVTARD